MATGESILWASGGLNQNDSPLNFGGEGGVNPFAAGDYLYALNCRIGESSANNQGAIENIPSTALPTGNFLVYNGSTFVNGTPATGTNTALAKYEDKSESRVYWFVKNSASNHMILMYDKATQNTYQLIKWSGLNFLNPISVTKINKYLIFTDGNTINGTGNPPRIIDVTTIYTLFATLNSNFSEYHISFSKWAPSAPPIVKQLTTAIGNVFIAKGQFQFAYRYVYVGGFKSCWSPPSNFVSNQLLWVSTIAQSVSVQQGNPVNFNLSIPGFLFDYNNASNTCFYHSNPKFYYFVQYIELAYRQSTTANWNTFSLTPVGIGQSNSVFPFTDAGPIGGVAETDIGQYFDAVPLLSQTVEAIDNRVMFGNNLDDLPPMANFSVTNVGVYSAYPTDNNWYDDATGRSIVDLKLQRLSFKENGIYKLGIIFKHYDGRSGLVQTTDDWTYTIPVDLVNDKNSPESYKALGFKIAAGLVPPVWATDYQIVRSNCLNIDMFILGQVNNFQFLVLQPTTGISPGPISTDPSIQGAISNYYDNNTTGGEAYPLIQRILAAVRTNKTVATSAACSLIYMDIANWCLDSTLTTGNPQPNQTFPTNGILYSWQPGDRVRFYGSTTPSQLGPFIQYDQEIIEYTGTGIIVSKPNNLVTMVTRQQNLIVGQFASSKLFGIEVYRPKQFSTSKTQNDVIYYEMGEWYPVLQPTTNNRSFSKTDWTWSGSASVTTTSVAGGTSIYNKYPIINGDCWMVYKSFYWNTDGSYPGFLVASPLQITGIYPIRSYPIFAQMTPDSLNAAGFWEHNNGRPLAAYKFLPVQYNKFTQVRFGGKFLEDSIFININNFKDEDQYIYPSEYGYLRALVNTSNTEVKNVGNILLAIFEEETVSIYVNRSTLEDLAGKTQVSLSDKVLGSYNTLLGSFGTLNPESISKRNSRVVFWSQKRGIWVRYSADGLTPISDNKMYNWFNDISLMLAPTYASIPATVLTVYDNYYQEWLTYFNSSVLPSTFRGFGSYKCCTFSEDDKRWRSFFDFTPDLFAALENDTYSIIGAQIHIHFAGTDYNKFYGTKKDSIIQFISNPEMRKTKVWESLNLQSTDKWSFPEIDGDFKSNNAVQQLSTIGLTDLSLVEDSYWAAIKRDANTANAASTDLGLINGDAMRSRVLTLLLKLDPSVTWYSVLYWLVVTYNVSEKTVKK